MSAPAPRRGARARRADVNWRLLAAVALCALVLLGLGLGRIAMPLALAYGLMGLVSLLAYRIDKSRAITGSWRIEEAHLHGLDFCFGIIGGLLGQTLFRHKTAKRPFIIVTTLLTLAHLLGLAALVGGWINPAALVGAVLSTT